MVVSKEIKLYLNEDDEKPKVIGMAYCNDIVIAGTADGFVHAYHTSTNPIKKFNVKEEIYAIKIVSEKYIWIGCNGCVKIYKLSNYKFIKTLKGHEKYVKSILVNF